MSWTPSELADVIRSLAWLIAAAGAAVFLIRSAARADARIPDDSPPEDVALGNSQYAKMAGVEPANVPPADEGIIRDPAIWAAPHNVTHAAPMRPPLPEPE